MMFFTDQLSFNFYPLHFCKSAMRKKLTAEGGDVTDRNGRVQEFGVEPIQLKLIVFLDNKDSLKVAR